MMPAQDLKLKSLFVFLSLIWGLTWIPIKIGVEVIPPSTFASARFIVAGLLLLLFFVFRMKGQTLQKKDYGRMIIVALAINTTTYSLLYYGLTKVPSGLGALLHLSFIPVSFMAFSFFLKEEAISGKKVLALLLGLGGLLVLFRENLHGGLNADQLIGGIAVILSSAGSSGGSILSRPLLRTYSPFLISSLANIIGGFGLFLIALLFEPVDLKTFESFLEPEVFLSWLFLVLMGSIVGLTIFLKLVNEFSPTKASMYAFISPIVAIFAGIILLDETFDPIDTIGMVMLIAATVIAIFRDKG